MYISPKFLLRVGVPGLFISLSLSLSRSCSSFFFGVYGYGCVCPMGLFLTRVVIHRPSLTIARNMVLGYRMDDT